MLTSLVILMVVLGVALTITLATHAAVHQVLRRKTPDAKMYPPISVLKPVKGLDDGLYDNLAAMARQDYPRFEIIIGAADANDPALSVAQRLRRDFPQVVIRIVSGTAAYGCNPKVQNLTNIVNYARFDHVLISDSNVRPTPSYLRSMVNELSQPNVGLVHSVLVGTQAQSLGGLLENLQLNAFVVAAVCGANVLAKKACVIGKSMLFRMSNLNRLGGLKSVRDVLAEDYVIGHAFERAGYQVALCPEPLEVIAGRRGIKDFANRHMRWHQMRRWISPWTYAAEPLMNPSVVGLVVAGAGALAHQPTVMLVGLAGTALKLISDVALLRALKQPMPRPLHLVHTLAKDIMLVGLWTFGMFVRTVEWRGQLMRIGHNSVLTPVTPVEIAAPESAVSYSEAA